MARRGDRDGSRCGCGRGELSGVLVPAAVGGAGAALILHLRALRRPDGYMVVDIGLAIAGLWLTLVMFAIVAFVVLG